LGKKVQFRAVWQKKLTQNEIYCKLLIARAREKKWNYRMGDGA
jgi:hypothetical protein